MLYKNRETFISPKNSFGVTLNKLKTEKHSDFGSFSYSLPISPELLLNAKRGFTLAETIITLVVLGLISAITIPALVRRHVEASNRTKIRKAMAAYENFMHNIVINNGIKDNRTLNAFVNDCSKIASQFQIAQRGKNDCVFKTADGTWWTVNNYNNSIYGTDDIYGPYAYVGFKQKDIEFIDDLISGGMEGSQIFFSDEPAFQFATAFDEKGILRVNDKEIYNYDMNRLYDYINGKLKLNYNKDYEEWLGGVGSGYNPDNSYCNSWGCFETLEEYCQDDGFWTDYTKCSTYVYCSWDGLCYSNEEEYCQTYPDAWYTCSGNMSYYCKENPNNENCFNRGFYCSYGNCYSTLEEFCSTGADYEDWRCEYCANDYSICLRNINEYCDLFYTDNKCQGSYDDNSYYSYDSYYSYNSYYSYDDNSYFSDDYSYSYSNESSCYWQSTYDSYGSWLYEEYICY